MSGDALFRRGIEPKGGSGARGRRRLGAETPAPGATPGEHAFALAYSKVTALRQQTHKKNKQSGTIFCDTYGKD